MIRNISKAEPGFNLLFGRIRVYMIDKCGRMVRYSGWFGLVIIGIKRKLRSMSRYSDVCLSSLYFNRF